LLLDRRCAILYAAFSVTFAAQRSSSVRPATEASAIAAVIARALLAVALCVRPTVFIVARPKVGATELRGRSGIAIEKS
jgi:hypothetical protein